MGSPPIPHLANEWLSQFDNAIQGNAKMFSRYMDDIIREIKKDDIDDKLVQLNNLHPNLAFTIEKEVKGKLPFLDMLIIHKGEQVSSTWFTKATDTGLILNYHALAPRRYKRSVVSGFVHRIFRACSSWEHINDSLQKAKKIMECNQYPPTFYDPIIKETIHSILTEGKKKIRSQYRIQKYRIP